MIRPDSSASSRKSWIAGLGIVIALLVCVGLMAHVTSIDAGTTTAAASAMSVNVDKADNASEGQRGSFHDETQNSVSADWIGLCAFLGMMCALTLLILRSVAELPRRDERPALRRSPGFRETVTALCGGPALPPALLVPLRV